MPENVRKAIEVGASAKRILELAARARRIRRRQQRIDEDTGTGNLSDEIATTILEFCRLGTSLRKEALLPGHVPFLLNLVRGYLLQFETSGHRAVKVSKRLELKAQFGKMRPKKDEDIEWMAHQAKWIANILWAIAPEGPIFDSALRKAESRAQELKPKRTPIEMYRERQMRLP
jgi:hypothetical protein